MSSSSSAEEEEKNGVSVLLRWTEEGTAADHVVLDMAKVSVKSKAGVVLALDENRFLTHMKRAYRLVSLAAWSNVSSGSKTNEAALNERLTSNFNDGVLRLTSGSAVFNVKSATEITKVREFLAEVKDATPLLYTSTTPTVCAVEGNQNALEVVFKAPRMKTALVRDAKAMRAEHAKHDWQSFLDSVLVGGQPRSGASLDDVADSYIDEFCTQNEIPKPAEFGDPKLDVVIVDMLWGYFAKQLFSEEMLQVLRTGAEDADAAAKGRKEQRHKERTAKGADVSTIVVELKEAVQNLTETQEPAAERQKRIAITNARVRVEAAEGMLRHEVAGTPGYEEAREACVLACKLLFRLTTPESSTGDNESKPGPSNLSVRSVTEKKLEYTAESPQVPSARSAKRVASNSVDDVHDIDEDKDEEAQENKPVSQPAKPVPKKGRKKTLIKKLLKSTKP